MARDLLAGDEGLREAYAGALRARARGRVPGHEPRCRTSCSSCSRADNLFRVGDENQSIYRFRNADVGVFRRAWRERRRRGHGAESITVNFRARGECSTRSTWLSSAPGASASSRCARARAARAAPPRIEPVRGAARGGPPAGALGRALDLSAPTRSARPARRAGLARGGGAAAGQAGRRAHARGAAGRSATS